MMQFFFNYLGKSTAILAVAFSANSMAKEPVSLNQNKIESNAVLYSAEWCGYCKKAKAFMNEHNIRFTELDLDKSDDYIDQFEADGGEGIPYLVVGDRKVSGFSEKDYSSVFHL